MYNEVTIFHVGWNGPETGDTAQRTPVDDENTLAPCLGFYFCSIFIIAELFPNLFPGATQL